MDKIGRLTNLIIDLSRETDRTKTLTLDRTFLAEVSCSDIALAQQNAIASGLDATALWRLWNSNRELLPDIAAKLSSELPENHVLQRVLAEHAMILCFIADLDQVTNQIVQMNSASSVSLEVRQLAHISEHLLYADQHARREDEVIFPELQRRGYNDLLKFISQQHGQIGAHHQSLNDLVWRIDSMNFDEFKTQLAKIADYIIVAMRLHIFIENNIVFPLAVKVINDPKLWQRIKTISDHLGYCAYDAK